MSQRSLAARTRFSEVQAAVNERVKDLSKIAQDRQAFLEQKDTAGGKKTMKAYLWKVCGDAYDTFVSRLRKAPRELWPGVRYAAQQRLIGYA